MLQLLLVLILGLGFFSPPLVDPPPPPAEEAGRVVGEWRNTSALFVPYEGMLIRDQAEWDELLERSFRHLDEPPPLEGGPGPNFDNSVAVLLDASTCVGGNFSIRHQGNGALKKYHTDAKKLDKNITCSPIPVFMVFQIDLDELGVAREDVTLVR